MKINNVDLLDQEGKWIAQNDSKNMEKFNNKFGVGFLMDSRHNVYGYLAKDSTGKVSMIGYYCSHYRLLSAKEKEELI